MPSITWGPELADVYDTTYSAMFEPSVLDPMTSVLAELAGDGRALEFAVGTGRVALALRARYVWPSELDLMARIAGLRLRERWAGWDRAPFTSGSQGQVAVFEKGDDFRARGTSS